jgi:replication factor C small subunit
MIKEVTWVEKYRPEIDDVILTDGVRKGIDEIVKKQEMPNLLFSGGPGTGKTSTALALCKVLEREFIFLNGSNCGVDTLRYTIPEFASSKGFGTKGKKVVIIDEAERMSASFSQGFNSFIEQFHRNCSFILTTNFPDSFFVGLNSRFVKIDFDCKNKQEKIDIFRLFFKRIIAILDDEGIEYDEKVIKEFIIPYFPDMRNILLMLQYYVRDNKIGKDILLQGNDYKSLIEILSKKEWKQLLDFVETEELEFTKVIQFLMKNLRVFDIRTTPILIKYMNDHQYLHKQAINKQVNLLDFFRNLMMEITVWPNPQSLKS